MAETEPRADWAGDEGLHPARRRWRWAAFVALLALVALAAGYLTWSKRAEQRLDEYVAELRRQGEPVEVGELNHRPIPSEDDAAIDLFAAAAALDKKGEAFDAYNKMELDGPLSAADRATIVKLVEGERDVLEKIRGARGKNDADWRVHYQSPALSTLLPHLNDQRSLANVSRAASTYERLRGNDAEALEYLRDVLAIADASDAQPVMIGHLVAAGVRAVATHEIGAMAPGLTIRDGKGANGAATSDQVRGTIRALLDETRSEAGFRQGLRGERVLQLDTSRMLADRKLDLNTVMGTTSGGRAGFGAPPMPRGMILTDALIMARQTTDLLKAYDASPDYQAFKLNAPPVPAAVRNNPKLHLLVAILMPAYDRFVIQQYRGKADRRLAAVSLALRLYAADHAGKYPAKLDELVPQYLPAIPKDPFAAGDKPLGYSTSDPSAPVVYSVGENGTDEGGSQTPINPRRAKPGRWEAADAVLAMKPAPLVKVEPPGEPKNDGDLEGK